MTAPAPGERGTPTEGDRHHSEEEYAAALALEYEEGPVPNDTTYVLIRKTDEPGGGWLFDASDNAGFEDYQAFRGLDAAKDYGRRVHGVGRYYRIDINKWRAEVTG